MTVREYAESILLAKTLEGKLAPPPAGMTLDPPHKGSYQTPDLPGRPELLMPRRSGETRTKIPSSEQLGDEDHRSVLLHFFCNHELIAVELMALALLKFPDAPDAFRRGLLHTLQEEQEHTRLYLDRMAATGTVFGEHSLSRMIWDHIAPMTSPIEYVSRLSLTFEQSNLDYANHYSKAFARVGDETTSGLLAQIYKDEIAHVGYGLKWLRRFKKQQETDWDAWHRSLAHPLTPVRAKAPGGIPFNREGRKKAGLDDSFIEQLQIYQRSRGRTPFVHFFNPNCEAHAAASAMGTAFQGNKASRHLEEDLEALILANAHPDDLALLRIPPSPHHLKTLKDAGLPLPEILPLHEKDELATRKLGGFCPWAWSPDSSKLFENLADNPTSNTLHPWREPLPTDQFSKKLTSRIVEQLDVSNNESHTFSSLREAQSFIETNLVTGPLLLKPSLGCAGRGHLAIERNSPQERTQSWLEKVLNEQDALVIEPLLPRLLDFSALYDISQNGDVRFLAFTRLITDSRGHYRGTQVAPKIGNLFPSDLTILFHQDCISAGGKHYSGPAFYKRLLPRSLSTLLPHYHGPVAVDALFYQSENSLAQVRPIVEVNARCSMGRIAHNLRRKLSPDSVGQLTIHRTKELSGELPTGLAINDPGKAKSFLAVWSEVPF
ncbi:DUF455 family protein [Roseibacillus persicicus]|uniref:DUF455 domain-containing protein n=1 Tax=Roseibacillus persicicus TaxID=454148 RepID=A0A918TLM0_9BACT|nr:DUF455 family protein [Roseibacillus persicicus]GHC47453.1 hypothetical protein GCM10007100_11460 [Roseibacillus persicicus]